MTPSCPPSSAVTRAYAASRSNLSRLSKGQMLRRPHERARRTGACRRIGIRNGGAKPSGTCSSVKAWTWQLVMRKSDMAASSSAGG